MAMADGPESPRAGDRNSKMHLDGFGFRELRPRIPRRDAAPLPPAGISAGTPIRNGFVRIPKI